MNKFNYIFFITCLLSLFISSCKSDNKVTSANSGSSNNTEQQKEIQSETKVAFGDLLIELESNVGWNAVNPLWKNRREAWVKECSSASSLEQKGSLLAEFESVVNWDAVNKTWADRRESWIYDCENAANESELAANLQEFESYILWEVVSENWATIRERWISDCNSLQTAW